MSNFKYCPIACHFCGETNTRKIEKIQKGPSDLFMKIIVVHINKSRLPTRSDALEQWQLKFTKF